MSRLFAFGCSFTNYKWPTWADIVGRNFSQYQNWGRTGNGNQYIFHSLIECYQKNKFTKDDTVLIMWSQIDREDRYYNGSWNNEGGSVYLNPSYPKEWVKRFASDRWYTLRDFTIMTAVKELLDHWGVNYKFLAMGPLQFFIDSANEPVKDLEQLFLDAVELIQQPSMMEVVYKNNDFSSNFSEEEYQFFAGTDWPSFEDFKHGARGCNAVIDKELEDLRKNYLTVDLVKGTGRDMHPRPIDHLKFVQQVLPEYTLTTETIEWVKEAQTKVSNFKINFPELLKFQPNRL